MNIKIIDYPGHADVNKITRSMLLSLYFAVLSVNVNGQVMSLRAPELFGTAPAYIVRSDRTLYGLILAPGAGFTFEGTVGEKDIVCRITQIAGEPIQQAEQRVPCYAMHRGDRWIGWIDFRGHERPSCAAPTEGRLPRVCRPGK